MPPSLAQVLNTLAHEIRTPLAVSQGYLKLYVDGRLPAPEDQQRALQQTREALGVIAALCTEMSKVSALSEVTSPLLGERLPAAQFLEELRADTAIAAEAWTIAAPVNGMVAATAMPDLIRATSLLMKVAVGEAREAPCAARVEGGPNAFTLLAGAASSLPGMAQAADAPGAVPVDVVRGGKGLSMIWASFVLQQHRVETWGHPDHRAAIGFRFPLVQV
jgi:hypothetical protein